MKVIKCPGGAWCDLRIQRQGCSISSYMGWLQENEPHTARKSSGTALSFHFTLTNWKPTIIASKSQAQLLLFVCAKVSMLATWHPCQSMQSAAETTSQEEYEALVCISKLQVITETIRLRNLIGLLWCETKDDVPMQGNESLFPSFQVFWFSLLLTLSAKQGWRNWHATTNHCCTFAFDPWKAPWKTVIEFPTSSYLSHAGRKFGMNKSFWVCSKLCTHELQEAGSICNDLPADLLLLLLVFLQDM